LGKIPRKTLGSLKVKTKHLGASSWKWKEKKRWWFNEALKLRLRFLSKFLQTQSPRQLHENKR
jgi:hypothetical protein